MGEVVAVMGEVDLDGVAVAVAGGEAALEDLDGVGLEDLAGVGLEVQAGALALEDLDGDLEVLVGDLEDLVGDLAFLVVLLMVFATWYLQYYPAYAVAGCYKTALADPVAHMALLGLAGLHVSDWFIFTVLQCSCFTSVHVIMFGFMIFHFISFFLLWIVKKGNEMILGCYSLRSTFFFFFPLQFCNDLKVLFILSIKTPKQNKERLF